MRDVYTRQLERRAAASDARALKLAAALRRAKSDLESLQDDVILDAPLGWLWGAFFKARMRIEATLRGGTAHG
jgi:hypothetical protein